MLYYLAYGSNLHPARLEKRLGAVQRIGVAELPGWTLRFHKRGADGSGKGNLIRASGGSAWGVVFQVDPAQQSLLHEFEGDGYDCVDLDVVVAGENYRCFCYLAQHDWVDDALLPHDWYRELIYLGARHAGFGEDYLNLIRNQPDQPDDAGQHRHAALLHSMRQALQAS